MSRYGRAYDPLIAKVHANLKHPDQRVAFLGSLLCFWRDGTGELEIGDDVEVMITNVITKRDGDTRQRRFQTVEIMPVDCNRHSLMAVNGFRKDDRGLDIITQGLFTNGLEGLTDRQNSRRDRLRHGYQRSQVETLVVPRSLRVYAPPNPDLTNVWIDRYQDSGHYRQVIGLTRLEDAWWACPQPSNSDHQSNSFQSKTNESIEHHNLN